MIIVGWIIAQDIQVGEPMMLAQIYRLQAPKAGRLAIMPRPRAGGWLEDEIASWKESGVDVVVSLIERAEIIELGRQPWSDRARHG